MITWPIFVALILAFFAVRNTIKTEEAAEQEEEMKKKDSRSEKE